MQINLDTVDAKYIIEKYDNKSITISGKAYSSSLILTPDIIIDDFNINKVADLNIENLNPIIIQRPEIIIFSSNEINVPPSPKLLSQIMQLGIGVEFMSIDAACRTYTVLAAEKRKIAVVFCHCNRLD